MKRRLLATYLALFSHLGLAEVAVLDAAVDTHEAATPSNFTPSAGDGERLMLVCAALRPTNDAVITTIPFGGQNLTKLTDAVSADGGTRAIATWLYLNEAGLAAASSNVFGSPTYAGGSAPAATRTGWVVMVLDGVDQSAPIASQAQDGDDTGTVDPIDIVLNNLLDGYAAACGVEGASSRNIAWGGLTELTEAGGGTQNHTFSAAGAQMTTSAGTVTVTFDQSPSTTVEMALTGVVVAPAGDPVDPGGGSLALFRRH